MNHFKLFRDRKRAATLMVTAALAGVFSLFAFGEDKPLEIRRIPAARQAHEPVPPSENVRRAIGEPLQVARPEPAGAEPGGSLGDQPPAPASEAEVVPEDKRAPAPAPQEQLAIEAIEVEAARARRPKPPQPALEERGKVSWTERYELGPGDSLYFALSGKPKLSMPKVPVAPDYTISYLQAKQISVRGLTVEELRERMTAVLAEHHRNPKLIVTPVELGSKKYTVLGKVRSNDVYKLDRPTRLLEAIAIAKGIVVGVRGQNATELADLKRSFVVRDGRKLPIDIEKLYRTGDMTQNVQIEPGDYIYIASNVHNETYVFGSVARPGIVPLTGNMTVMGAIAESSGYAKYAWKGKVLLIRGSIGNPQPSVINTREILRGKESDVRLQPGDIVYVHRRPWSYAEEILDVAIKAYIQAATAVAIQGDESVSIGL